MVVGVGEKDGGRVDLDTFFVYADRKYDLPVVTVDGRPLVRGEW